MEKLGWIGRQAAAALFYGIAYALLRQAGFAHFVPLAGLKFAALLLLPPRYWLALLFSEAALLAYALQGSAEAYGEAFYLAAIVPPIGLLMPIFAWLQGRLGGLRFPRFKLQTVLACALVAGAVLVADALWVASLIGGGGELDRRPLSELAVDYFLGTYSGMLAVVPAAALVALERYRWHSFKQAAAKNHALLAGGAWVALAVCAGSWALSYTAQPAWHFAGQAALFIPAVYFFSRWGWKGVAVMGTIVSFGIVTMMPAMFDLGTLMSQTMMALFLAAFIVLGIQAARLERARAAADSHLQKARLEQLLYEVRLQQSSMELSFAHVELDRAHRHLLLHLDGTHNRGELQSHKDALARTTSRLSELANALSPSMGSGHPDAFTGGPMPMLMERLGIEYRTRIHGQLSTLSRNALSLVYRLACEAVAFLLKEHPSDRLAVSTHTEQRGETTLIHLSVFSDGQAMPAPPAAIVMKALGTYGLGLEELRIRAQLFQGEVLVDGPRVRVVLRQERLAE
jgi:hypothetical protein